MAEAATRVDKCNAATRYTLAGVRRVRVEVGSGILETMVYRSARILNLAIGAWLFASAFQWTHSTQQFQNVVMVGFLVAVFAAIALVVPLARYVNSVLAGWLVVSAFALPSFHSATIYNSVLLGIAIFAVSLTGIPEGDWPPSD